MDLHNRVILSCLFTPILVIAVACKQSRNTESETRGNQKSVASLPYGDPILTLAHLSPTPGFTLSPLSETEAVTELNENSDFYDNHPDNGTKSPCDKLIGRIKVKANAKSALAAADIDMTKCTNDNPERSANFKFTSARLKTKIYQDCTDGDLSTLNGKTLDELENIDTDNLCRKGSIKTESEITTTVEDSDVATPYTADMRQIMTKAMPNLSPCANNHEKGVSSMADGCIWVSKRDSTVRIKDRTVKTYTYKKLTPKSLRGDITKRNNVWYLSGSIDLIMNDWTGTVSYSGVDIPPTYTITQDESKKQLTGSLKATSGLLLSESPQSLNQQIKAIRQAINATAKFHP